MRIGQICSRRVVTVTLGASLSEVVALMQAERIGSVIVTQSPADRPVVAGVITDRDIVRAQLQRVADFSELSTADTMTRDPLVLSEHEEVDEALRRLRARAVRRAPVVDASGALVGVISTDDLLAQIARDVGALAAIVSHQRLAGPDPRERGVRPDAEQPDAPQSRTQRPRASPP